MLLYLIIFLSLTFLEVAIQGGFGLFDRLLTVFLLDLDTQKAPHEERPFKC